MPSLLAVGLAVAVIVLVGVLRDGGSSGSGSPALVVSTSSPHRTVPATTSPPPSSTPTPSGAPTTTDVPTTSAPPPPPPAGLAPGDTTVAVYNVTRRRGLAAAEGNRLGAAGYHVVRLSNRPGYPVSTTTAYYDPGNAVAQASAEALVAKGIGVQAAAPRPADVPATAILVVYVTA